MLALLGSILGLFGSLAPRLLGFFEQKQNHAQEIEMMRLQSDSQLEMMKLGFTQKMAEINAMADISADTASFTAAMKPTGVAWIDGLNGLVRPVLALAFFGLYAAIKAAQYAMLADQGVASALASLWGDEDWAVWAAIVTFYFGNRTFNKERGR